MKRVIGCLFVFSSGVAGSDKCDNWQRIVDGEVQKGVEKTDDGFVITAWSRRQEDKKQTESIEPYGTQGYCAVCDAQAGEFVMTAVVREFNQADVDDSGFVDEDELFQYATRNALDGLSCPDLMDNDGDGELDEDMVMFIPQAKYTDMQHYVGQLVDLDDNGKITIEEWDFVYYFLCDSDMSIDADGPYRDSSVIQYANDKFNLIEGCQIDENTDDEWDDGFQNGDDNLELKLWVEESFEKEETFKNQNLRDLFKKDATEAPTDDLKEKITTLTKVWIDFGDNEGCCGECNEKDCKWQVSSWYCTECYTHTSWMPSMRDDDRVDSLK